MAYTAPSEQNIEAHELMLAFVAVNHDRAGRVHLQILAEYDVDPLDDDAEARIEEIIADQCEEAWASNWRAA